MFRIEFYIEIFIYATVTLACCIILAVQEDTKSNIADGHY